MIFYDSSYNIYWLPSSVIDYRIRENEKLKSENGSFDILYKKEIEVKENFVYNVAGYQNSCNQVIPYIRNKTNKGKNCFPGRWYFSYC